MKKLLLSSIIMLGICSFVTAQNATDAKAKRLAPAAPAAATPQKSAVATQQNVIANADGTEAAAPAKSTVAPTDAQVSSSDVEMSKKKEAAAAAEPAQIRNKQKIAADKAAANKKSGN